MKKHLKNKIIEKLFDNASAVLFVWNNDSSWSVDYVSKNVSKLLGYKVKDFLKNKISYIECIHKDHREKVKKDVEFFSKNEDDFFRHEPYKIITKNKQERWVSDQTVVNRDKNGNITQYIGYLSDVTDSINLNLENEKLEKKVQLVLESTKDGIWEWDLNTDETYFSKQWSNMLGYKEDELENKADTFFNLIHKDDKQRVEDALQKHFRQKDELYNIEVRLKTKDGGYLWILARGRVFYDKEGNVNKMIGSHINIDENKKYQQQIELLNSRFKNMFSNHDAIMLLINPESGQIIDANKSAQRFYGYTSDEFLKLNVLDINTQSKEAIDKKREQVKKNSFILEHKKKDGQRVTIETRSSPIQTEQGLLLFSIIEDITNERKNEKKLKKALQQLQNSQKAAKLGVWELNVSSNEVEWSDEAYNIFEIDKEGFSPTYDEYMSIVHPDDKEYITNAYLNSLKTKEPYSITHRIVMRNGAIKYVSEQCNTQFDLDGNPLFSYGTVQDITELTLLDAKVNQEKDRYKRLLDLSSDGIFIINKNFKLVEYSQAAREMLGYSDEEMLGLKISDWDVKYESKDLEKLASSISKDRINFETIHKRKDGSTYNASITAVAINIEEEELIYASVRDITNEHRLQKEIMYEKNFISSIVDSANAIITVIDSNGVMIKLNSYAEEFSGYTQKEISSEPYKWKALLPLEIQDRVLNIIEEAKRGNIIKSYQNAWVSKDAQERMFEWSNTVVKKEDGSMDYLATIGVDITQNEEHKKLFETIFNTSKDGLAILDLDSKFLEFNHAYLSMTGFTREELLTKKCIELSIPEDKQKAKEITQRVFRHGHVDNFEKTCIVKDGKHITISMSMAMMPDKKSFLISTKDITQRKAEQDELKRTKDLAQEASRSKSEFLANMSHEIRTPLNGMIGLTKLTLETELDATQREYLKKSLSSANVLLSVISDILDYSKIEAQKIEICQDKFFLDDMMQNLSDMFSYQAYEKGIDYIFTVDPKIPNTLIGDQVRFTQILTNLIANGIKFTKKGHVNVHLELKEMDSESAEIECLVQDTGIGISKDKQKKLFRAFEQGDSSTTKKYGGTGLGLMISKKLVELMESEIWLKSELDKGTTLGFTLKLKYIKDELFNPESISQFKEANFLFVDDSEIEREYVSNIFTSWGIKLVTATDGEDAYIKIKNGDFNYVMVDWKMPKLDGLELLQKLQNDGISTHNILLVTAHNKEALLSKAHLNGIVINKAINKPYTPSTLYETLFSEKYQKNKLKDSPTRRFKLTKPRTALLVEDNEINQLVATKLLENIGFIVTLANNGEEALKKAKSNSYDLIFMDIHMPIMNGYTATMEIREFDKTTPIIALSAAVMEQDKELCLASSMNGHLSKPINMSEVEKLLINYFNIEYIDEIDAKSSLLVNIHGVDMLGLQKELGSDEQSTYRYYKNFLQSYTLEMQDSLKYDRTSTQMKDFIHKLKGTSGNLRINTIYKLCIELEKDIESEKVFTKLFVEMQHTLKEIENKIIPLIKLEQTIIGVNELKIAIDAVVAKFESYELVIDEDIENIILGLKERVSKDKLDAIEENYIKNETDILCELLKAAKKSIYE